MDDRIGSPGETEDEKGMLIGTMGSDLVHVTGDVSMNSACIADSELTNLVDPPLYFGTKIYRIFKTMSSPSTLVMAARLKEVEVVAATRPFDRRLFRERSSKGVSWCCFSD